jgi:hypothetical protein
MHMRTMMRVTIPVETGNKAIADGVMGKIIQETMERIKPEAAYFTADHGQRTVYFFCDIKDSSQMPVLGEPLFIGLNAKIDFQPVMNLEELKAGLEKVMKR